MTSPPTGLRERKKAKTRVAIREAALSLFEEQGYGATTIDQIAEAAEVSQSTFFRYFPTKEAVILTDEFDPQMVAELRAQPAGKAPGPALVDALRIVFGRQSEKQWADERRRQQIFNDVPELRARVMQQTLDAVDLLAGVLAERVGRPAGDLRSRVVAGALIGVILSIMPPGIPESFDLAVFDRLDEAMQLLTESFAA